VINKHFFKTLMLFTSLIILGLVVIFVVSYFDEQGDSSAELSDSTTSVAN